MKMKNKKRLCMVRFKVLLIRLLYNSKLHFHFTVDVYTLIFMVYTVMLSVAENIRLRI
jgi:hypothetical protein